MKALSSWLSPQEKQRIADAAISLLERVGVSIQGSRHLSTLAEAGTIVDFQRQTVRFPETVVREAVDDSPREILMAGIDPRHDVLLKDGAPSHFMPGGCAGITLDHVTGERRPSTLDDLRCSTALFDEIPELEVIWAPVTASDVPREKREIVECTTMLRETGKHVTFVDCPADYELMEDLASILAGDLKRFRARPQFGTLLTVSSPFTIDGALLDFHVAVAGLGAPVEIYAVPLTGATGPASVGGSAAQALAEVLGALTAIQVLVPGARTISGACSILLDMRSGNTATGAPETGLTNVAAIETSHYLGLAVSSPGLGTDAASLGPRAAYEKALKGLVTAAAGADLVSGGIGLLEAANVLYLPQIPVDVEIVAVIKRLLEGVEVGRDAIGEDMIAEVGIGGSFLGRPETRRLVHSSDYGMRSRPLDAGRGSLDGMERDEAAAARDRVEALLTQHAEREPYLAPEQILEMERLCDGPL